MIDIKINIEQFTPGRGRHSITLNIDDFQKLHREMNKLAGEINQQAPKQNGIDLSNVEQGLLINELCKRVGVNSIITKKDKPFSIITGVDVKHIPGMNTGICETRGMGPANIIIVSNKPEGGNVNGK